ncbi:MAG: hypothetical protein P4L99_12730 [Chthoniobacter sp.]|nr:hypothetical protein [Chthoniobacter sp.]
MKTMMLLCFFWMLASARAAIGDTLEQCIARYGQPVASPSTTIPGGLYHFEKDGLHIGIGIFAGHVDYLQFSRTSADPGEPLRLSEDELRRLLMANAPEGHKWVARDGLENQWVSDDGNWYAAKLVAQGAMVIQTKAHYDRTTPPKPRSE